MSEFHYPLLLPLRTNPGYFESVLVHPSGGGLSQYLGLASRLAKYGSVHGLRAEGLLDAETPSNSIPAMAARYADLLDGLDRRPDVLIGWSMGGVLSWELATRLAETGPAPAVVMIDSYPSRDVVPATTRNRVHSAVVEAAHNAPGAVDLGRASRTARAHIEASRRHRVEAPYAGRALLIACASPLRDRQVARWRRLAPRLTVRPLDCGHFEVFQPTFQRTLLRHLDEFLTGITRADAATAAVPAGHLS